jgi:hypothetical protein
MGERVGKTTREGSIGKSDYVSSTVAQPLSAGFLNRIHTLGRSEPSGTHLHAQCFPFVHTWPRSAFSTKGQATHEVQVQPGAAEFMQSVDPPLDII